MKNTFIIIFTILISFSGFTKKKSAYKLYNAKGHKVSYKKMLKQLAKADVVFFWRRTQ